ncbi:DUF3108 domain-containing protein [Vibrio paucivorans]|uniref:DUF3108 domain-containing protein n=1 Tax=Vibrio paucivorans TaxID=2829489 RepID=A0A9X3HPH7_9VIBR|nr:DUF3108 domain-containing protein [Vibrio paucivorans]MCW8332830.1 hypothetical protein [Vibrio paucivorans]
MGAHHTGYQWLFAILILSSVGHGALASESLPSADDGAMQLCEKSLEYALYLGGIRTGKMSRVEYWKGDQVNATSKSRASILGIGTSYRQESSMTFDHDLQAWVTKSFHQIVTGFKNRDMKVTFPEGPYRSDVDLDGEKQSYYSDEIPLRDLDTLSAQIRFNLINGSKEFELVRQASDTVEPYQYTVLESETLDHDKFGKLTLTPVKQDGADEITFYIAPSLDYQVVKATYHGFILNGVAKLTGFTSSCN